MIDIHTHILPGLDDGSPDMECSVEMAELAAESGVEAIIATPHCNQRGAFENYASEALTERLEALRSALEKIGTPLEVYLGAEVYGTDDAARLFRKGKLATLGGSRYLLTEFDFFENIEYMQWLLNDLLDAGCVPIIAHPERYFELQERPRVIEKWLASGMGIQINKGSLFGRFGSSAAKLAHYLLREGMVTCIASDAHGSHVRTPDMSSAMDFLSMEYSDGLAQLLLVDNPRRILQNRELVLPYEFELF
ncbi:MAG: CpsB/CapC family capsule biosynthesis tyrosine phosphatase [Oscillospiraceae bacterium]|nr:CpsB/CapC family capsule biosynthesis tyrosine phosphatase [Oscillospiraceae bacterium]